MYYGTLKDKTKTLNRHKSQHVCSLAKQREDWHTLPKWIFSTTGSWSTFKWPTKIVPNAIIYVLTTRHSLLDKWFSEEISSSLMLRRKFQRNFVKAFWKLKWGRWLEITDMNWKIWMGSIWEFIIQKI